MEIFSMTRLDIGGVTFAKKRKFALSTYSRKNLFSLASSCVLEKRTLFLLKIMGYFANGTEAQIYFEMYCEHCIDWRSENPDEEGCPVWDAHGFPDRDHNVEIILDLLIPRDAQGNNLQCAMFIPRTENVPDRPTASDTSNVRRESDGLDRCFEPID